MRNYAAVVAALVKLKRFGPAKGLETIKALCKHLHNPQKNFKAIHVAGTNGKGSVCHKIAKTLTLAGYKTALYTSPHINAFEERIKIDGIPISRREVAKRGEAILQIAQKLHLEPIFFEVATALAFQFFAEHKVDFAVIETGLGGKIDATNIVEPVICAITSIGLEHTAILGDSIEAIAVEKGGIIKTEVPLVLGPKAQLSVLEKMAKQKKASLIQVRGVFDFFDDENSAIAKTLLQAFPCPIKSDIIDKGIQEKPSCRFEFWKSSESQKIILDVAHNPAAFASLYSAINCHFNHKVSVRVVFGLCKDKDLISCVQEVVKTASCIHLVSANNERSQSTSTLKQAFLQQGFTKICEEASVYQGVKNALKKSIQGEIVVICGSFYIMQEAQRYLNNYLHL